MINELVPMLSLAVILICAEALTAQLTAAAANKADTARPKRAGKYFESELHCGFIGLQFEF